MPSIIDSGLRTQDSGLRTDSFCPLIKASIKRLLYPLRAFKDSLRYALNTRCSYKFQDRRKNADTLIVILAGYKPFLWNDVFERIKRFAPSEADICIVSSGKYDERLIDIAARNGWSYLSTKRNCVALAQNVAINLHTEAEFIYKIDEDIFVTEHCFDILMKTYERVKSDGLYEAGFVAPLIPLNAYAHVRVLDKLGLIDVYEKKFERAKYCSGRNRMIEASPEVAKFFWGEGDNVPTIDEMSERFHADEFEYRACPIRFSIGFILFTREIWNLMGMWRVPLRGTGMGNDEIQICCLAMSKSKAVIVSENAVAGHLSFGLQNEVMKDYYLSHRDIFGLR